MSTNGPDVAAPTATPSPTAVPTQVKPSVTISFGTNFSTRVNEVINDGDIAKPNTPTAMTISQTLPISANGRLSSVRQLGC